LKDVIINHWQQGYRACPFDDVLCYGMRLTSYAANAGEMEYISLPNLL